METPASPPVVIPSDFKSDKIIGVIIMVLAGMSALFGVMAISMGSMFAPMDQKIDKAAMVPPAQGEPYVVQNGHIQSFPTFHMASMFSIIGWVAVGMAVLQLASGIGVFKSSRKGLIFALAVAVLSVLGGVFGIIIGVAMGLYVILRLWGNVGPKPA